MKEYTSLLKNIALNDDHDDIYRLLDIFLEFSDDYIKDFKDKGVLDEDLKQECALVISENILSGAFLEKNNRRQRLLSQQEVDPEDIFREIIHDISTGCEEALTNMTQLQEHTKKAGEEVLARVNLIDEGVKSFCSEYGMKPTPSELSDYLGIDEDIIIEVVELSGYEIKDIDFDTPIREGQF